MRNLIYFFTGTGNSYWAASKISDSIDDCSLIRITDRLLAEKTEIDADRFGIVFPVYAWGPPPMVEQFLRGITVKRVKYVFSLAVHGGAPENTQGIVNGLLKTKGRDVDGFFDLKTPSNYIVHKKSDELAAYDTLRTAEKKLGEIITDIAARDCYPIPPVTIARKILKSKIAHSLFNKAVAKFDENFFQTADCAVCGECVKICPAQNISLDENKKLVWHHKCQACMACLNWCAVRAIRYKDMSDRNYYRNPWAAAADIRAKSRELK